MGTIRFNQVFITLLVISAVCAFAVPPHVSARARANFAILFYPVARPAGAIAGAIHGRVSPDPAIDDGSTDASTDGSRRPRSGDTLLQENQELRVLIASLQGQMSHLVEQEAQRKSVGSVRELCEPFRVIGPAADVSSRALLHITGNTSHGVRDKQPALYGGSTGGGIAGRIDRASVTGSTVRLITDRGFSATVSFVRFVPNKSTNQLEPVRIATPDVLATGDGHESMWIHNLTAQQREQSGIAVGDWVVLADNDWPGDVQGYRVGRVKSIGPYSAGPGFVEIRVDPPTDLKLLSEVLVMTK